MEPGFMPRLLPAGAQVAAVGAIGLLMCSALAGSSQASGGRAPSPACRAGRTLFHRGGVRAFLVVRTYVDSSHRGERSHYQTFYVCRPASRKPRLIYAGDPFTRSEVNGFRIFGVRLGFIVHSEGFSNGSETSVGWLDLRIGRVRLGLINAGVNAEPGDPTIEGDIAYAIASDGAVAIMSTGEPAQEIDLLLVGARSLGPPRKLLTASGGGLDPASIAITDTSVTWRTKTGQPGSAPR